jgi:hypothetical protein
MSERFSRRLWAAASAAAFAAMVTMNGLANAVPLNGVNTGQLSDEIPNLFVPAGVTFAIWGVIYALLLGYAVAVAREGFSPAGAAGRADEAWEPADGMLFSANAALNAVWILAWHWRLIPLSLAVMAGILVTLILLEERGYARRSAGADGRGRLTRFFLRVPILVYLGWICVATIANVTAVLVTTGWSGFSLSESTWTVIVIAVGAIVGCFLVLARGAVSSGLVVLWAYAGIVMKRSATDPAETGAIIAAAYAGMAAVALAAAVRLYRNRRKGA